ncbi:hypothetical protein O6H91_04G021400 [Diphasiastrum complanatum]|uniref:Uncharacterized protein n=1 Tax=Diphasiastrum complanatum TaxID=34168 RepID=A0ACC2DUU6_DIPCM|nr:hypothetical protein O6H91_04G021400 [Diphasiastrum complanatum]
MATSRRVKKVVVAIDESSESLNALVWALDNMIEQPWKDQGFPGDTLVLLHSQSLPYVYISEPGIVGPSGGLYSAQLLASMKQQQEHSTDILLTAAKNLCTQKNIKAVTSVIFGDPRDNICDFLEESHADMLVIGSHGYGTMKRALLGSVSDYCARYAKCPVLVVKKS